MKKTTTGPLSYLQKPFQRQNYGEIRNKECFKQINNEQTAAIIMPKNQDNT